MKKYRPFLKNETKNQKEEFDYKYNLYAIFALVGFIGFYFINPKLLAPGQNENFYIRLVSVVLATLLLLRNHWPQILKNFIRIFWYITLTFNLPFFFTFMAMQNDWSLEWSLNVLMAFTILSLLTSLTELLFMAPIGTGFACFLEYYVKNNFIIPSNIVALVSSYITILIFCSIYRYLQEKFYVRKLEFYKHIESLNKTLEEKVRKRTKNLKQALDVKEEFLNNISHEIRTPIGAFSIAADTLANNWENINESQKYDMVQLIAQAAGRIKNLSMHLIDATKFHDKVSRFQLRPLSLTQLIKDFIDEALGLYVNDKKIKINFYAEEDYCVLGDYEALGQVVRNIVLNAIKFSPQSSTLKIHLKRHQDNIRVTISDEGIGIPAKELKKVFSSFYQSSRSKTGAGGVGLGLAIAKQIIEAHKGKIWAKNNPTQGSSFIFTLPQVVGEAVPIEQKIVKNGTILIIDDEESMLDSVELGIISKTKLKVLKATDGKMGIELLEKSYDEVGIVLLDVMMPGMNGIEVLKVIRRKWPHIKVIMNSGVATSEEREISIKHGAFAFLTKPYNISQLLNLF